VQVKHGLSLEKGMSMYNLEHSELFWEKALDTKLLLGWGRERVIMAFRGTASLANALADVQASQHRPSSYNFHRSCYGFSVRSLGGGKNTAVLVFNV
jgi:hypothetical protein